MNYLALGDSYTRGEGVDPRLSWPVQLANLVRANEIHLNDPEVLAQPGWNTGDLITAVERQSPADAYDLVTLQVGALETGSDSEEFRRGLRSLLEASVGFAGDRPGRVVVLSIPDWSETPFARGQDRDAIESRIASLNSLAREEVEDLGARWVDITAFSRSASRYPTMLADDGIHPSGMMHAEWARLAIPQTLAALRD